MLAGDMGGGEGMGTIGENIKRIRKEKNLTLNEVAEKAGLSRITLGYYEAGERTPNIDYLKKVANGLECSLAELSGETVIDINTEAVFSAIKRRIKFAKDAENKCAKDREYKNAMEYKAVYEELENILREFGQDGG